MNKDEIPLQDDPVFSKKVLEMITVANEYCHFLETASEYPLSDFLGFLQKILPLIYLKASLLPDIRVSDEDATEHYVTEEEWEAMFNELHRKLDDADLYLFLDHDKNNNTDPIRGSIAESITDIYQDLKDFILLYQKPMKIFKECAVRDCKYLFETRFGYRIVDVMTAVHNHLFQPPDPERDS
jgi:hypothetical protein